MSVFLSGLGTVTPPHSIAQTRAAEVVSHLIPGTNRQRQFLTEVYRNVGVETRHSVILSQASEFSGEQTFYVPGADATGRGPSTGDRMRLYEAHSGPLAVEAAQKALDDAGLNPREVTHLVTVSCSGFSAPGFDIALINLLPLSRSVVRVHVGFMGCHGVLNGLSVARAFIEANPNACVLVTAVELCTLHHQYGWDRDQLVANALFADGAAAVVCRGESSDAATLRRAATLRGGAGLRVAAQGSIVVSGSEDLMSWRIGDHGFHMTLSGRVPDCIQQNLLPWLTQWLAAAGCDLSEVGGWAVHPGGPRILQACESTLNLSEDKLSHSREILRQFGNMSSPTVLFILERLRNLRPPFPWLLLGFGPGLTIEALLLDA